MLAKKITPGKFNGRQHDYVAFIFNVKKVNTRELLSFMRKKYGAQPDFIVEPKYDGLYIQISKEGNSIKAYSDQGNPLQLPDPIIEALKKLPCDDLVAEGELETYVNKKHQPRGITIGLIHRRKKTRNNVHAVLTLFDCLYIDNKDISHQTTLERLEELKSLPIPSELTPIDTPLNRVPYERARSLSEIDRSVRKFCRIRHFEGAILKPTKQDAHNLTFIKFKRYIEFALKVINRIPTKTKGVYNYDLGAINEKGDLELVGRSHNSELYLNKGDVVAVACYNVSVYIDNTGKRVRVRLYSSTIQNKTTAPVNTIKTILQTAKSYNMLEIHKIT